MNGGMPPAKRKEWVVEMRGKIIAILSVLLLSLTLLAAWAPLGAASPGWTDPVDISTQSEYDQYEPQIAVDAEGISHVVWYGYGEEESSYAI